MVVPDNTATATTQIARDTRVRDTTNSYAAFSTHFGFGVVAARSYTPKDKASVEKGVDIAERWIIEYLDDRTFFSIEELNTAVAQRVEWINHRNQFRGQSRSRWELFEKYEREELLALPE
ncbi:Mobile element protein [Corynebacterium glutamicum]|nr:Mobile element protein [Corynebacterium glutamicum]